MTVRELIEHLKTFDPELPVVFSRMSDWTQLEADAIDVEQGIWNGSGAYVERWSAWAANRGDYKNIPQDRIRPVLAFPGN